MAVQTLFSRVLDKLIAKTSKDLIAAHLTTLAVVFTTKRMAVLPSSAFFSSLFV